MRVHPISPVGGVYGACTLQRCETHAQTMRARVHACETFCSRAAPALGCASFSRLVPAVHSAISFWFISFYQLNAGV